MKCFKYYHDQEEFWYTESIEYEIKFIENHMSNYDSSCACNPCVRERDRIRNKITSIKDKIESVIGQGPDEL